MKSQTKNQNWIAVKDNNSDCYSIKEKELFEKGFADRIAEHIQSEANAKLISAAPDLLEENRATLEGLKLVLQLMTGNEKYHEWVLTKIVVLENLIKKATL